MNWIRKGIEKLLGLLARVVYSHPGIIILFSLLFTGVMGWLTLTRLVVINNTNALISEKSAFHKNYLDYKREFAFEEDCIITIRSDDVELNRRVADRVGQGLRGLDPKLPQVIAKLDFSRMKTRFLYHLSQEELLEIEKEIEGYVQGLKQSGAQLNLNSMLTQANGSFNEKHLRNKENWEAFKPFIDRFVEMLNQLADQIEGKAKQKTPVVKAGEAGKRSQMKFEDFEKQLSANEYISFDEGRLILLMARPMPVDPKSAAPYEATVHAIRAEMQKVQAEFPGVKLGLTGEPVLMDDELQTSTADSQWAGIISFILVAILFFFSYREMSRPGIALGVLLMATVWSLGASVVLVGHLNIISQAFVAMVIGLGIDFGIQIMGRYEEELARGKSVAESIYESLTNTGAAVVTGGSTTAAAFFTMCFNDFIGLAEFGVVAGTGILLCLFANLALLPAFYVWRDRRRSPEDLRAATVSSHWAFGHELEKVLFCSPKVVLAGAFVLTVYACLGIPKVSFDHNLLNLQNPKLESVREVHNLLKTGDKSIIYGVALADNLEEARELTKRFEALPTVDHVVSLASLIPENQSEKQPIIRRIVGKLQGVKVSTDVKDKVDVALAKREISELLEKAREGEKQAKTFTAISKQAREAVEIFAKMIPPLERAQAAIGKVTQEELGKRLNRYQIEVFGSMQQGLSWLKAHDMERVIEVGDLPVELKNRYLAPSGRVQVEVYPKENIWDRDANEKFVKDLRSIYPNSTGTPVQNYEYIEVLRRSYQEAAGWAFLTIVILIALHFRNPLDVTLAISPLVMAVIWTLGLMGHIGWKFNPANIITLPLVIGVGVAYGVYTVDRYREDQRMDLFSTSTGKAIALSALTTMIGFGALMISSYRGLFSIGLLMSVGVTLCLITSLVVLPQVLLLIGDKKGK